MADKAISELVAASNVGAQDLFVVEQGGTAKKMTGQVFTNWLTNYADGHGGIQSISNTGTSGLVDTYTITYADQTTSTFTVTNAKSISSITQYFAVSSSDTTVPSTWVTTRPTLTATNKYLWSYFRFSYNNGSPTDTTKTVIGVYGDTGAQTYVWIRWSSRSPVADSDMGDQPDSWIGIYVGTESTAPTSRNAYEWYEYKGEKGETGDPATLDNVSINYAQSDNGSVVPSGNWVPSIPNPTAGMYLWTRVILSFNSGDPITYYSVSRYGIDGSGSVSSVNGTMPDANGNVQLTASYVPTSDNTSVQTNLDNLESGKVSKAGDTMTGALHIKTELNPAVAPSTNTVYQAYYVDDMNGNSVGSLRSVNRSDGSYGLQFITARTVSGNSVGNAIGLYVDGNGERIVSLSSSAPWRSALGIGTDGAWPITVSQGGTGGTTAEDAMTTLGGVKRYTINGGNAITTSVKRKLSFSGTFTGILIVSGNASTRCGMYVIYGSTSTVVIEPIKAATSCTITTGTGYFDITSSSGSLYPTIFTSGYPSRISETAAT